MTRRTLALAISLVATSTLIGDFATAKEVPATAAEKEGFSTERLARLDAKTHSYVDQGRTAGVITLIARHGKIVHFDVYGKADIEAGTPLKADSLFRMYSMTKPVTSTALLMLYEEGKFQLDDPLEKYLPELKDQPVYVSGSGDSMQTEPAKRKPTVRDVLRHTAGFTYGNPRNPIEKAWADASLMSDGLAGLVPKIAKLPLVYQPGTRWVYSVSHDVQAVLVERLSGMKFEDFVKQRIFTPLEMKDSTLGIPAIDLSRMTTSYRVDESGKLVAFDKPATSIYKGVGGGSSLTSSARDYLRFAQMLANGGELFGTRLLSPQTVKLAELQSSARRHVGGLEHRHRLRARCLRAGRSREARQSGGEGRMGLVGRGDDPLHHRSGARHRRDLPDAALDGRSGVLRRLHHDAVSSHSWTSEAVVGERVQEGFEIGLLLFAERELCVQRGVAALVAGDDLVRLIVVVDHFAQRAEHAVVHVGRGDCDVAQGRHLELAVLHRVLSDRAPALVRELRAVEQTDVAEPVGREVLAGMALRALAAPDEQQPTALRRFGDRRVVAVRVPVVRRIHRIECLLVCRDGPADGARSRRRAVSNLKPLCVFSVGIDAARALRRSAGAISTGFSMGKIA